MNRWTAHGFEGAYRRWNEVDHPPGETRRRFLFWGRRLLIDPFDAAHAVPHTALGPGWWLAAVPDEPGRVIAVTYHVEDAVRVVSCLVVVTVPLDQDGG